MNELLKRLMAKKGAKEGMDENYKNSKMSVLKDLHDEMGKMMADDLHGLHGMKKVTVAAPDQEGLQEGLSHAQQLMGHGTHLDDDSMEDEGHEHESEDGYADGGEVKHVHWNGTEGSLAGQDADSVRKTHYAHGGEVRKVEWDGSNEHTSEHDEDDSVRKQHFSHGGMLPVNEDECEEHEEDALAHNPDLQDDEQEDSDQELENRIKLLQEKLSRRKKK